MEKIAIKLFSIKDKRRNFWSNSNDDPVPAHSPQKEKKKIVASKNVICDGHKEMAGEEVCPWCVLTFNLVKKQKELDVNIELIRIRDIENKRLTEQLQKFRKISAQSSDECVNLRKRYEGHMKLEEFAKKSKKKKRTIIF